MQKHFRTNVEGDLFRRYWEPLELVGLTASTVVVMCPYEADAELLEFIQGRVTYAAGEAGIQIAPGPKAVLPALAPSLTQ